MSKARKEPKPLEAGNTGEIARLCHALSDATRLAILDRLRNREECVCNLTDLLDAGQSRLSFHLKTLKEAGLVRDRRDGRWIHYSLNPGALDALEAYVLALQEAASEKINPCCN
jgi:ArsR family transcriptional regulator